MRQALGAFHKDLREGGQRMAGSPRAFHFTTIQAMRNRVLLRAGRSSIKWPYLGGRRSGRIVPATPRESDRWGTGNGESGSPLKITDLGALRHAMRFTNTVTSWVACPERAQPVIRLESSGFSVTDGDQVILEVVWSEVREVVAFKEDRFTVDDVCVGFRTDEANTYHRVTEEFAHYSDLLAELPRRFPGIRTDWFREVTVPAFAPNWTTLWGQPLRLVPAERAYLAKALLLPGLLAAACLVAGLYGALHHQISYTVSPPYFHAFKFRQLGIPEHLRGRVGASLVGWHASWRMGLVAGLPVVLVALVLPGWRAFLSSALRAFGVVALPALVVGLGALCYASLTISDPPISRWSAGLDVADRVAFARVGAMHDGSYLGSLVGILTASLYVVCERLRTSPTPARLATPQSR